MNYSARVDAALGRAMQATLDSLTPETLRTAMHYAVFPGGGRIRPILCLKVASACGDKSRELADAAACAVEFVHCASLVHDDLPMFDDAAVRRGQPSLHRAFGEPLALLVGDGLLMGAFQILATCVQDGSAVQIALLPALIKELASAAGAGRGLVCGQASESEAYVPVEVYHAAKTASLFEAACAMGALAGGQDPTRWRQVGRRLGEAYQVADDLADVVGSQVHLGKPTGVDGSADRPSAVDKLGLAGAQAKLATLLREAIDAVPLESSRQQFGKWIFQVGRRLLLGTSVRDLGAPAA